MVLKKKFKKIGIIVGLEERKRLVSLKNNNIICEKWLWSKSFKECCKKLIKKKIDVLINFGLAKSADPKIKKWRYCFYK